MIIVRDLKMYEDKMLQMQMSHTHRIEETDSFLIYRLYTQYMFYVKLYL